VLGRTHFARFLVETGHVRDYRRAFKRYLGRGGRCYVPCDWAALEEAVAWITAAGGDAVVAHPARYGLSAAVMRRLLDEFKATGGVGLEVLSSSHDPAQARAMAAYAREYGLYASVGSDFHQPGGWAEVGSLAELPGDCVPIWTSWRAARWTRPM
jgi:predicted metal-dependent phosphoesterase TrpH